MIKKNICWIMLVFATSFTFAQTTIHTNSTTGNDTTGNGSSSAPYKTFHKAYTEASSGDTINLTGTFTWTDSDETGDTSNGYVISKNITIQGNDGLATIQAATTSGTADRRIFEISVSNTVTLTSLIIQNGKTSSDGGGIKVNGSAYINKSVVQNNHTSNGSGGGIEIRGRLKIENSQINNNIAHYMGGGLNRSYNSGSGGIPGANDLLDIINCTIAYNKVTQTVAYLEGGGVFYRRGSGSITNSTIVFNSVVNSSGTSTHGIGTGDSGSTVYLKNNIIALNITGDNWGGDLGYRETSGRGLKDMGHNIFGKLGYYDNDITVASSSWLDRDSGYGSEDGTFTKTDGSSGSLNLDTSLAVNESINNTKTLKILNSNSIAIDNGSSETNNNISIPNSDQRGASRSGSVDIGAYEYDGPIPLIADVYTNSVTGNDTTGNGSSSAPYKTFHKAYTEASSGDILSLTGTFTWTDADETGDSSINGYTLSKDISIIGQTATSTIIQAATTSGTTDRRVFTIGDINLTVKNVTIRNGYLPNAAANKGGAGIHLYRGAVDKTTLFENCIFTENHQTSSNSSSQWYGGGAILVYNTANSPNGTITFKNSVFEHNSSDVQGGFLWSYSNSSNPEKIIFNRCTINNNSSGNKQLVYGYYANLEFLNSTLFNNSGRNIISSIYDGNLSIINSTIYSNNNSSYAVSGSSKGGSYGTHNVYIRNSIIAHNNSEDLDIYNLDSHDVKFNAIEVGRIDYNAMVNGVNDNLITSSANLFLDETLKNNSTTGIGKTLKITNSRSVAINNGTNTAVNSISIPTDDQRGASRSGSVDIGAYEYDGPLNADLNSLTISSGNISETFAYNTTTYHATVSSTVSSFTVSTTTYDSSASVTSDGLSATGTFSKSYSLTTGTNTITFLVTASDNSSTQTYTLLVDREAPSSNTNLSGLTINSGNLSPSFSSGIINYQANVSGMVSAIKVTPTKSDPHTSIKINGSIVSSGSESSDISLITGTNTITINILAQDGTSSKTYYLIVNKASEFIHIDATNSVSYSGSGNNIYNIADGTLIGTKTSGVTYDSSDGGGLNFNGTTSNITFSNSNTDFGNTFTIVAWVKPETQNDINTLISNAGAGRSTSGFKFHWNNWQTGNGRIVVEAYNGVSTLNDNEVCIDGWQQIVWSVDATNRVIKIYKNGVAQNTSGTIDAGVGTSGQWYIGGMSGTNYRMKATLGVLKVFPEVLSDTDIQTEFNKYTSRFTLPTGPTINSFSPSSGNTGTEVTLNGVDFTGVTEVLFNNTSATYTVVSDTQIKTTVPSGVSSGTITVKNGCVYGIKSGFEISSLPTPGLAITPNGSITKSIGETINIIPSSSGSGSYTYNSNNTLVATVNSSGVVSVIGEGNATIQVTQLSDGSYAGGTVFLNVSGIKAAAVLTGLTNTTKVIGDPSFTVNASSTNTSGPSITYSSSNTSVATINNSSGLITIVGIGNTTITAMQSADSNFSAGQIQMTLTVTLGDSDGDGINDASDNCPTTPNADQADTDGDGVGDVCDNAPNIPNADQADTDGDGTPDAEDNDDDNDGVPDTQDAFPLDASESIDTDGDGIGDNADTDDDGDGVPDTSDNAPLVANPSQTDSDGDGIGDAGDSDDDNDGFSDTDETTCGTDPLDSTSLPIDTDADGTPDCIDTDDDNDGFSDTDETTCGSDPLLASSLPADADADGTPDCIDTDDDNDGFEDTIDAFPLDATEWLDTDADGIGNNADLDDDNDGQSDDHEMACGSDPLDANETSADADADGLPNCVDEDDDNDGVNDTSDAFPLDPSEWTDTDADGIGNNADTDDDNDGYSDFDELSCGSDPLDRFKKPADQDQDGLADCIDSDRDGDGVENTQDIFPDDASEWQDTDGDGLGDNFEVDDDNDGVLDSQDAFPLDPAEWSDEDNDGIGDNADTDDNNDGFEDEILFPSGVLTPNSSGLESTWKIINLEKYPNARVRVYDKNGLEVLNQVAYKNDWRGTYKNSENPLPAASYYYVIQLNTGEEPITGWMYITY